MNSLYLIIGIGCVYAYIGIDFFVEGKIGLGITFVCYALANLGLYFTAKGL